MINTSMPPALGPDNWRVNGSMPPALDLDTWRVNRTLPRALGPDNWQVNGTNLPSLNPDNFKFFNGSLPPALDPDNWQTAVEDTTFVYSAHLDPRSDGEYSWIVIMGAIRTPVLKELGGTDTSRYDCTVWYESEGDDTTRITSAHVEVLLSTDMET